MVPNQRMARTRKRLCFIGYVESTRVHAPEVGLLLAQPIYLRGRTEYVRLRLIHGWRFLRQQSSCWSYSCSSINNHAGFVKIVRISVYWSWSQIAIKAPYQPIFFSRSSSVETKKKIKKMLLSKAVIVTALFVAGVHPGEISVEPGAQTTTE